MALKKTFRDVGLAVAIALTPISYNGCATTQDANKDLPPKSVQSERGPKSTETILFINDLVNTLFPQHPTKANQQYQEPYDPEINSATQCKY